MGLLIQDSLETSGPSVWTGVAGVLQCVFVLIRYLMHSMLNFLGYTFFFSLLVSSTCLVSIYKYGVCSIKEEAQFYMESVHDQAKLFILGLPF